MRPRSWAPVLTIALVFASGAFLVQDVAGQVGGDSSLSGQVCGAPYWYPMPLAEGANPSSYCEGRGLPGALVHLTRPGIQGTPVGGFDQTAETDDSGSYLFSALEPGSYHIEVSRAGFRSDEADIEVEGDAQASFSLEPREVQILGRVEDEGGAGLADAEVRLCCSQSGELFLEADADGDLRGEALAGWYSASARAPGFQDTWMEVLVDGATLLEFQLLPVPPQDSLVRGTVRDQDGDPVADARVYVYSYGGCCEAYPEDGKGNATSADRAVPASYYGENWTDTDAQGRYSMHVYSGSLSLRVEKADHAAHYAELQVASGRVLAHDVELLEFPEKTARLVGRFVDAETGKPIRYGSLSVWSPQYGISECGREPDSSAGSGTSTATPAGAPGIAIESVIYPYPYDPGCAIEVRPDGTFEGDVTPGYAIVSAYQDAWRACGQRADGRCDDRYLSWTRTVVLAADGTTELVVALQPRPEPDAMVSGYLVDGETNLAIPGAHIQFSNQETYSWGDAATDEDGSYRIRLRSGYTSVYVYADGYLPWQGTLDIAADEETPFDVLLTPGQTSYGYCCMYYAHAGSEDAAMVAGTSTSAPSSPGTTDSMASGGAPLEGAPLFEDLEGGLGAYDPDARAREHEDDGDADDRGSPGLGLVALCAALLAALALRRRRGA